MRLPVISGSIRRRVLVNFRVDAEVMSRFLPPPFRPKLHCGYAIAGICLIRLEQIRPAWLPGFCGISSENAAHRIAVVWDNPYGGLREGVFIPRRDTGSWLNHFAGGRIFPGEHHLADFSVTDNGSHISMSICARDGRMPLSFVLTRVIHFRSHHASSLLPIRPPSSRAAALATPSPAIVAVSMAFGYRPTIGRCVHSQSNTLSLPSSPTSQLFRLLVSPSITLSSCATSVINGTKRPIC